MITRRRFLGQAAAGAASLAVSGQAFSNIIVPQKKEKLGIALVGLGNYSTNLLLPALQLTKKISLVGIVTGTPAKAEKWKMMQKLEDKNIYNYQNFDSIANNPDIDVIYVVLPPSMHAEYTIRAANAGKHVFCEKPMAVSADECQRMIDACNKNKVKLAIGYRMQHEPNTRKVIEFTKKQTYGKVVKVEAAAGYRESNANHWKLKKSMGGGSLMDMGVYAIQGARYGSGLEPTAVTAKQTTMRPELYTEVDENIEFTLEFPGGVTGVCETSFGKGLNNLQVTAAKGWYKLTPFQSYSGVNGVTSDGVKLDVVIPNEQTQQLEDDATSLINGTPLLVPGEEGQRDIRIVEAIFRSVKENKKVAIG